MLRTRLLAFKKHAVVIGFSLWGLFLISCVTTDRTIVAPPNIAGATFVGSKQCATCHEDVSKDFGSASHANLAAKNDAGKDNACESCHGPGSPHVKAGGGAGTIVNPKKSPEACLACHIDKRGEFSLPNSHPVMAGRMSCQDCHDPHKGNAIKGTGATLDSEIDTCTKCHTAQKGPFIFEHNAIREGCTICHNPHGTVNPKMLLARDGNLCQRCHLGQPTASGQIQSGGKAFEDHATRMIQGTCWTTGCHEAVHGSNINNHFRR